MSKRFTTVSLLIILISACTRQVTPPAEAVQSTQFVPLNTVESTTPAGPTPFITEAAVQPAVPTLAFIDTATVESICPGAPAPHIAFGQLVSVVSDNIDKLKLRSEPRISPDTILRDLDTFTELKVLGGLVCVQSPEAATSYWFWMVEVTSTGEVGWIAEGDSSNYFIE
jgi:hypothetical protein